MTVCLFSVNVWCLAMHLHLHVKTNGNKSCRSLHSRVKICDQKNAIVQFTAKPHTIVSRKKNCVWKVDIMPMKAIENVMSCARLYRPHRASAARFWKVIFIVYIRLQFSWKSIDPKRYQFVASNRFNDTHKEPIKPLAFPCKQYFFRQMNKKKNDKKKRKCSSKKTFFFCSQLERIKEKNVQFQL